MKLGTDLHTHMDEAEIPAEHLATDQGLDTAS